MTGKQATKRLRILVSKLELQMESNYSQNCSQSINHETIHASTNAVRESEIVRKGIVRLEKQITQLLATNVPMDRSDIALINKLKVVDVPSLNNAVGDIQKSLQRYVNFSGIDYEYCETISDLMDKAQGWILQVETAYNEAEVHSINTSKGDDTEVGVFFGQR